MNKKLGKLSVKHDPRNLKLSRYLDLTQLTIPPQATYSLGPTGKTHSWGMYGNDTVGDCTTAAAGHIVEEGQLWNHQPVTPTTAQCLAAYSAITGYVPGDASTDNGATCLDVLNYWKTTGIAGNKIDAFLQLDVTNQAQLKAAIFYFGAAYLGIALPITAQAPGCWRVVSTTGNGAPGSWGGHCIPLMTYNAGYTTCITWGAPNGMTWDFVSAYADEAYVVLDTSWAREGLKAPSGFDYAALHADLALL